MAGWNDLKLGNGGFITRLDIANDGTMVCCTDSFGGYVWDSALDKWRQMFTASAMPASMQSVILDGTTGGTVTGLDDLIVDHANSNNMWMVYYGDIYKSINKGVSWQTTGFTSQPRFLRSDSGAGKSFAPYSAIDPNNFNVGYFSTASQGMFRTTNGGSSFSQVTELFAGLPTYNTGPTPSVIVSSGTDSTTVTIGTGSKTFSNNSASFGLGVSSSAYIKVWRTSDASQQMFGTVTASAGASFTLNVTSTQGSGTYSDWTVSIAMNDQNQNAGAVGGGHRICFDTSGGTVTAFGQTVTKNVFVHTYGVGTWKSITGGVSWTAVSSTGLPAVFEKMAVDSAGVLWVTDNVRNYPATGASPSTSNFNKYSGTTWTNNVAAPGTGFAFWYDGVSIDPLNAGHIGLVQGGAPVKTTLSTDGGSTWTSSAGNPGFSNSTGGDVAWLTTYYNTNPTAFFGCNAVAFDSVTSGKLWIASEGVWYTTPPTSAVALTVTQQTRGIEEFIAIRIVSPASAGGTVFMGAWDFPLFYSNNFNAYPSITGRPGNAVNSLQRGYDLDWQWNAPTTLVDVVQGPGNADASTAFSALTTTGGATPAAWTAFSNQASMAVTGQSGGNIAVTSGVSSGRVIVFVPVNSATKPQVSTDDGVTWADAAIPSIPSVGWGPFQGFATAAKTIDSDKANGNIFLYNVNDGISGDIIYKYTRSTGVWSAKMRPAFASQSNINEQMKSSGVADVLFFTPGQQGAAFPTATPFYYTNDGWQAHKGTVTNFQQVITFGFGAIFAGQSFPSIYAAGWYSGVYGIWMCKNFNPATGAGTWAQIGEQFPRGILDFPKDIDGDKVTPGKVYMFNNGGAFYGEFGDAVTINAIGFSVIHGHAKRQTKMIGY